MAVQRFDFTAPGGGKFSIWGEQANLGFFVTGPLTPAASAGASNKQVLVKATTRRQYPGDTTAINVAGSQREVLVDPTRRSGSALPGRSIVLVADAGLPGEERRQFTLKGRWLDFHAWLSTKAKMQVHAYNSSGARYTIPMATATP